MLGKGHGTGGGNDQVDGLRPKCPEQYPRAYGKMIGVKYQTGDYIKVEFPDEVTGLGEWMWVRVTSCDDAKQLVFGTLDNAPVNDSTCTLKLGSELAISFDRVREHKKGLDFGT